MVLGYPISELAWLAALIIAAGALTGIFSGLFGIGGGSVTVPVLYEVFRTLNVSADLQMQLCIGTSLAIIVPTTYRSYIAHKQRGAVIPNVVMLWGVPAVVGTVVGAVTAAYAPSTVFKIAFAIFATFISIRMFAGGDRWRLGSELPGRGAQRFYGFFTGLISSMVGVSGGAVSNAVLTAYGQSMQRAVATSAGIGVPITIAGTLGYMLAGWKHLAELPPLSIGFVSVIGVALMAPVASYTATYGVRLAHWLPRRQLEIAFAIFLGFASVRFIVSLI